MATYCLYTVDWLHGGARSALVGIGLEAKLCPMKPGWHWSGGSAWWILFGVDMEALPKEAWIGLDMEARLDGAWRCCKSSLQSGLVSVEMEALPDDAMFDVGTECFVRLGWRWYGNFCPGEAWSALVGLLCLMRPDGRRRAAWSGLSFGKRKEKKNERRCVIMPDGKGALPDRAWGRVPYGGLHDKLHGG